MLGFVENDYSGDDDANSDNEGVFLSSSGGLQIAEATTVDHS